MYDNIILLIIGIILGYILSRIMHRVNSEDLIMDDVASDNLDENFGHDLTQLNDQPLILNEGIQVLKTTSEDIDHLIDENLELMDKLATYLEFAVETSKSVTTSDMEIKEFIGKLLNTINENLIDLKQTNESAKQTKSEALFNLSHASLAIPDEMQIENSVEIDDEVNFEIEDKID